MNIIHTPAWQQRTESLERYVYSQFDSYDGEGQLESLAGIVVSQTEAFARLLELLAQKGVVSAPDITEIVRGVRDDNATLSD